MRLNFKVRDLQPILEICDQNNAFFGFGPMPLLQITLHAEYLVLSHGINSVAHALVDHGPESSAEPIFDPFIRGFPFPDGYDHQRIAEIMAKGDVNGLHGLAIAVASELGNKKERVKTGSFAEFLALIQAVADLCGTGIHLSFPVDQPEPKDIRSIVRNCWPHDIRGVLRPIYAWYAPSRSNSAFRNGAYIREESTLHLDRNEQPSGHDKLEAMELVRAFFARPDLKLTRKQKKDAEARLGFKI